MKVETLRYRRRNNLCIQCGAPVATKTLKDGTQRILSKCRKHLDKHREDASLPLVRQPPKCWVKDCSNISHAHGLCNSHLIFVRRCLKKKAMWDAFCKYRNKRELLDMQIIF